MVKQGQYKPDYSPEYCRQSLMESLNRLGVQYIDLYIMRSKTQNAPTEDSVKAIAVSNLTVAMHCTSWHSRSEYLCRLLAVSAHMHICECAVMTSLQSCPLQSLQATFPIFSCDALLFQDSLRGTFKKLLHTLLLLYYNLILFAL